MGFFKNLLNRSISRTRFEMIEDRGNGFYAWNGSIYKSDVVRACIRPKVKAIGKLIPQHIRNNTVEGFKVTQSRILDFCMKNLILICQGKFLEKKWQLN